MDIQNFSLDELQSEIKRRKEINKIQKPKNELLLRMNTAVVGGIDQETEILDILALSGEYELNIQKAFLWGLKCQSEKVTREATRLYKQFSGQRFYESRIINFSDTDLWFNGALLMLNIDEKYGLNLIIYGIDFLFEDELSFIAHKSNIFGYDKEKHIKNRNIINLILGMAKDKEPYSRIIRKTILKIIRDRQSGRRLDDFLNAKKILRWC